MGHSSIDLEVLHILEKDLDLIVPPLYVAFLFSPNFPNVQNTHKNGKREIKSRAESNKGVLVLDNLLFPQLGRKGFPIGATVVVTKDNTPAVRWCDGAWFDLKSRMYAECTVCRLIMLYGESQCWIFSNLKAFQSSRPCWKQEAKAACSLTRLCISTLGWMPGLIRHSEQMFVVFGDAAAEKAKKHRASWIRESVSQIWMLGGGGKPHLQRVVTSCRL